MENSGAILKLLRNIRTREIRWFVLHLQFADYFDFDFDFVVTGHLSMYFSLGVILALQGDCGGDCVEMHLTFNEHILNSSNAKMDRSIARGAMVLSIEH